MNIANLIREETKQHEDTSAVVDGNSVVSYKALFEIVDVLVTELRHCNIKSNARAALLCREGVDYIVLSLALLSVDTVIVPIADTVAPQEIEDILERMQIDIFLYDSALYTDPNETSRNTITGVKTSIAIQSYERERPIPEEFAALHPAFIRFSSGTTGDSKGVVISHESILERTNAADKGLLITSEDTVVWVLSMAFHFVVTIILFLRRGATILISSESFPNLLIENMQKYKATVLYASPFHYTVLNSLETCTAEMFSDMRLIISTAMHLSQNTAETFYTNYGHRITEAYGIIEVGLPCINVQGQDKGVGTLLPDYEITIQDADEYGVGLIYIKGPGMFDAYVSPWQKREDVLIDGWFNTGDMGYMDDEGCLTIVGRRKNVINFAGMKIFPNEVEAVLNQFPQIRESCVYGVSHPQYGQLPHAKIVLAQASTDLDLNALRRFCYSRLAKYEVPKDFECVEKLNKTTSGKILRS